VHRERLENIRLFFLGVLGELGGEMN
jgi:hypothetical protein